MKISTLTLALLLSGCGAEERKDAVDTLAQAIAERQTTEPTTAPAEEATKAEAESPVTVEKAAVKPKDFQITFTYKVSSRKAFATDYCDTQVESIMDEEDLETAFHWTCRFQPTELAESKAFRVSTFEGKKKISVYEEVFLNFKSTVGCKLTGTKTLQCLIEDNFFEVYVFQVTDEDRANEVSVNLSWKVYYTPKIEIE